MSTVARDAVVEWISCATESGEPGFGSRSRQPATLHPFRKLSNTKKNRDLLLTSLSQDVDVKQGYHKSAAILWRRDAMA